MNLGILVVFAAAFLLFAFTTDASAQTKDFVTWMGEVKEQFGGLAIVFALFCWSVGGAFAIQTFMKLKGLSTNAQDPNFKVSTTVITGVVAICLIAIPDVIGIGIGSLFGNTASTVGMGTNFEIGGGTSTSTSSSTPFVPAGGAIP